MFKFEDRFLSVLNWIHIVLLEEAVLIAISSLRITELFSGTRFCLSGLWLFLPLALSSLFLRTIHGFPLYLMLSAAVTAGTGVLSKNPLVILFSILIFFIRGNTRIRRAQILADIPALEDLRGETVKLELWDIPTILDSPSPMHCILYLACYLLIIFRGSESGLLPVFYLFFADALVLAALLSTGSMKQFLIKNKDIANIPFNAVKSLQRLILCVIACAALLFMLPSVLYGREPLTALRNLRFKETAFELPDSDITPGGSMENIGDYLSSIAGEESTPLPDWVHILFKVIAFLLVLLLVVLVLRALFRYLKGTMRSFRDGEKEDEITFLGESSDENILLAFRKKRAFERTPSGKIRRLYRRLLRKKLREMPTGAESPSELEKKAGLSDTAESLHILYEKARYDNTCTEDDLARCRDAAAEL